MKLIQFLKQVIGMFIPKSVLTLYLEIKVFLSQKKLAAILPQGSKYPVFLRRKETDFWVYNEVFVGGFLSGKLSYNIVLPYCPKFMIDCGGNTGLTSIYFKLLYPEIKIVTIEPEKSNFELLKRNIAPYQKDIIALNMGVWNKTTKLVVKNYTGRAFEFVTEEVVTNANDASENYVDAIGIKDVLSKHVNINMGEEYGVIDLLKIDIEGAENELFRTNYEWLAQTKAIVIEFHNHFRSDCSDVFNKAISNYHFKEISFHGKRSGCGVGFYINEDLVEKNNFQ
jgi:FkbM family methyltransferase